MKRIIIRVQWTNKPSWRLTITGGPPEVRGYEDSLYKWAAVREAVRLAWVIVDAGHKVQVVSHRKDGVIQWERTYPRSSDPRRSKG